MKEQEYEQGKWYWVKAHFAHHAIARFKCINEEYPVFSEGYNIFGDGGNYEVSFTDKDSVFGLATPAQIEQCLKAYAEKNGYVEGAKVDFDHFVHGLVMPLSYLEDGDLLGDAKGCVVYASAEWAELVKEPEITPKNDHRMKNTQKQGLTQALTPNEKDFQTLNKIINGIYSSNSANS